MAVCHSGTVSHRRLYRRDCKRHGLRRSRHVRGQWLGTYSGTSTGRIMVNVDEFAEDYRGVAYLAEDGRIAPSVSIPFKTADKSSTFKLSNLTPAPIHLRTGNPAPWESIKEFFPGVTGFSNSVEVTGSWSNEFLELSWSTNLGILGTCKLPRSRAGEPSELVPLLKTWEEFKGNVASLTGRRWIFRGQRTISRLRTSFHRTGRSDLARFLTDDMQSLLKHLSIRN